MLDLSANSFSDALAKGVEAIAPRLPGAIITLLAGYLIIKILGWIAKAFIGLVRLPKGLHDILGSVIKGLLWVGLIVVTLQALGLGNLALVVSGSIAALGLALASGGSTLAADVLAGIFLAKDRDFGVGDEVIVASNLGGGAKTQGIVKNMDMRRIRIEGQDGKLHVIPNSVVERNEWIVVKKR